MPTSMTDGSERTSSKNKTPAPAVAGNVHVAPGARNANVPRSLQPVLTLVAIVAALYFGREVFVPLAIAILLTFALSPLMSMLRRWRFPRTVAAVTVVVMSMAAIFVFGAVVASQLAGLANNLPSYQTNIQTKIRDFRDTQMSDGIFERASRVLENLSAEIENSEETSVGGAAEPAENPIPVIVREPDLGPLEVLQTVIGPLIEPLATFGIVIVFVIFMLLRREDLRDRFIRLAGSNDLHRTTQALQDAGRRVGQYLLMQLVVNVTYAIPIGIGLWLIGIPNALLWGLLALVLRFVPYVGPVIAAMFPLALSVAVDPGWSMLLWTASLFIVLELISNNIVEPMLYGSRTGLSPVAIILAAIFWTWLWGPIGLLLSTPLTVCFVVLGRHVPQFEFLDILLGNEPVMSPRDHLYQRLLAGDPNEATERAEDFLEENSIRVFYQDVAIPALVLVDHDRVRGVLDEEQRQRVAEGAIELVENLLDHEDEPAEEPQAAEGMDGASEIRTVRPLVAPVIVCLGGRGNLDDAAAVMTADILTREGAIVHAETHLRVRKENIATFDLSGMDALLVGYLNRDSLAHARYLVRRVRRVAPRIKIVVAFWNMADGADTRANLMGAIRADAVVASIDEAVSHLMPEPIEDVDADGDTAPAAYPAGAAAMSA
jgi:predicted PurR-regulated permease PerM